MKAIFCLLFFQLILLPLSAQELIEHNDHTHILQFLAHEANQPVSTNITIFEKNILKKLTVHFPDDTITTEYIIVEETQFKFQLSQIRDQKLLTVHFIGTGDLRKEVTGKFTALVEGELRKDMSGTFTISKAVKK